jgi:hypothetical protein
MVQLPALDTLLVSGMENFSIGQRFPNCGVRPPGDIIGPLGGASCVRDTYFERNIGARLCVCVCVCRHLAWLKYEACFVW